MPNVIRNGDFESGLDDWNVRPEEEAADGWVRVDSDCPDRSIALHIFSSQYIFIEQNYPWIVYADSGDLTFRIYGYGAAFYVNIHYEDGSAENHLFYGHYEDRWEQLSVPVISGKGITKIQFEVIVAVEIFIDDIILFGSSQPSWAPSPIKPPSQEYNVPPLLEVMERRLIGIEKQMSRIANLLTKQQYPDFIKELRRKVEKRKVKSDQPV
jgi:hypothetical protein